VVLVCVDKPEDGARIVELKKAEFPLVSAATQGPYCA
jgi:hypothetical protein